MKVIVLRSNLREALGVVEKTSGDSLNLPILKNVLLNAEDNKITLTATNLEIAISYFLSGKIIESGKITVPLKTFFGIMQNLSSDRLNLEKKKNNLVIKTDNYEAALQGLPADDFPITPKIKNTANYLTLPAETLKQAFNEVLISAQFSNLRPELNSILLCFSGEKLKFTATDSFRLAEKTISGEGIVSTDKKDFKILLPLKSAQELSRILKNSGDVKIFHDDNQALIKTAEFDFLSRLVEGSFPDYETIIPKKFATEAVFSREEFKSALKLASILGSKNNEVKIKIQENKKIIEIMSADQGLGENNYLLPAKISGRPIELIFNWKYLVDVLDVLKTEDIFWGLNAENDPAFLRSPGDASYFYILKPIVSV